MTNIDPILEVILRKWFLVWFNLKPLKHNRKRNSKNPDELGRGPLGVPIRENLETGRSNLRVPVEAFQQQPPPG
jgi:hypothetical protein